MTSVPLQLTTAVSLPEPGPGASSLESLANGINTISINTTQAPTSPGAQRLYCIPNFFREPGGDNKYYVVCVGRKLGIFNNWCVTFWFNLGTIYLVSLLNIGGQFKASLKALITTNTSHS